MTASLIIIPPEQSRDLAACCTVTYNYWLRGQADGSLARDMLFKVTVVGLVDANCGNSFYSQHITMMDLQGLIEWLILIMIPVCSVIVDTDDSDRYYKKDCRSYPHFFI
jgi:hypothetical protein